MTELIRRVWMQHALLGLAVLVTAASGPTGLVQGALAQDKFPARQIEMMVPWGPGGGADVLGRTIARWLEADLKVNVPVLNNAGAMGSIGLARMVATGADGHAIGVMTADTWMMLATTPGAQLKTQDVVPLGVLVRQPSGIFVKTDSRFKTWQDVVDEARAKPGVVSIAITGAGSPDEVAVNYLAKRSVNLLSAGFNRPGERFASVLGGHVDLLYEQAGDIKGQLDGKALRPILFFANQRLPAPFAGVGVSKEFGYDILLPQFRAIVAKAGVDPKRLDVLAASIRKFSQSPEYANYLRDQLALSDSYIGMAESIPFMQTEAEVMRALAGPSSGK